MNNEPIAGLGLYTRAHRPGFAPSAPQKALCSFLLIGVLGVLAGCEGGGASQTDEHEGHDHAAGEQPDEHDRGADEDEAHGDDDEHAGHDHAEADWCAEHGLPESMCTVCNPGLVEGFQESGDWCAGHGFPESVCPTCNPATPPVGSPGAVVALSDIAILRSGIRVAAAATAVLEDAVELPAEVQFDPDLMAHVSTLVDGQLVSVAVTQGDRVDAGQELATFRSVALGQARADLNRADAIRDVANRTLDRQRRLRDDGISSERSLIEAQLAADEADADVGAARSRLRVFGVRGGSGGDMPLTSPIAGEIIERHATRGENVASEDTLFVVADTSAVWVIGRVYEQQVPRVARDMEAVLTLSAYPGREWRGSVDYLGAALDESSRTLPARVELPNTDGVLRPGMFGSLRLGARVGADPVIVLPSAAVQTLNNQTVVFIEEHSGEFATVNVVLGREADGRTEVLEGVEAGQSVVVEGAFILLSELLRGELADGCGGH